MRAATELWVKQLTIDRAEQILAVLDTVAPDVWVSHNTLAWLVELQAVPTATPIVVGHLFPMMIPSRHRTPPMLPLPAWGVQVLNRAAWRLGRFMTARLMYDEEINELRATRGLPPAQAHVGFGWERAQQVLLLSSEHYWPRPPDWQHITYTGFTIWGDPTDRLPADLSSYLDDGPPPVLVTLGTSAASNARDGFELAAAAIEKTGERPLLLVGNQRNRAALADRDDVWTFGSLPAVLTACKAVVHAAGHGTTAAALHAAIPQVVMPQTFDQVEHARRLGELGVGATVPWKHRSQRRLERGLRNALAPAVSHRARQIAEHLRGEDGPSTAADTIETAVAQ
ncbi:MAG: glycosyltransferase [Nitriliruptorales bacterium]|nr:glycosyltransferase [Nitriliruptorales bacterium]